MSLNDQPNTIEGVEQVAGRLGIALTAEDYSAAQELMNTRRAQLEQEQASTDRRVTWAERFNRFYPVFLRAMHGVGDVTITIVQTALVGPGVMLVLLLLLLVEWQRVLHGIGLFEVDGTLASLSALSLVILNLSLELLISYVENRQGWSEPIKNQFSLRLFAQWIAYLLGNESGWKPRPKSPAIRFRTVLRIVTFSILVLALAGSMRGVIERTSGNWIQALELVITGSSLLEMVTWIGGLLFAAAAVLAAQALTQYAAKKGIELATITASSTGDKTAAMFEAVGATGAAALFARLKDKQKTRRLLASSSPATYATETAVQAVQSSSELVRTGQSTLTPLQKTVYHWIMEHPESATLSHKAAAELASTSESTVRRVRTYIKEHKDGESVIE